jgi:hypothetical protein
MYAHRMEWATVSTDIYLLTDSSSEAHKQIVKL